VDVKLEKLNHELDETDNADSILRCLNALGISNITPENISWYSNELKNDVAAKRQVCQSFKHVFLHENEYCVNLCYFCCASLYA